MVRARVARHGVSRFEGLVHVEAAIDLGSLGVFGEELSADEHLVVGGRIRRYALVRESWSEKGDQRSSNGMAERGAESSSASIWDPVT